MPTSSASAAAGSGASVSSTLRRAPGASLHAHPPPLVKDVRRMSAAIVASVELDRVMAEAAGIEPTGRASPSHSC